MKVHFIGGLEGNRDDYVRIIHEIEECGWELVTKHSIEREIKDVMSESQAEAELYARKMKQWIQKADVVVVEITKPSLGTGFEVALSLESGKPVIALYRQSSQNSHYVLKGLEGKDKLQVINYTDDLLTDIIHTALSYAIESIDTRFNFFISPKHQNYMDWVAKNKKLPRAVYLRRLIEEDMKKNKDYEG